MSSFTQPLYSRTQVKKAGRTYVDPKATVEDRAIALSIVNNWRSAHGYPLNTFQMSMRRMVRNYSGDPLVAQRIKRLPSIRHKLERFPTLNVSQMQDLGGCRAVVASVDQVDGVVDYILNKSRAKHPLLRHDPYIDNPKPSGYRGVHLVYAYNSDRIQTWNGLKVELQIRTRLQHSWATAVETVGTFTRQALKSSQGQDRWLRFFALMGTAHAIREGRPPVPDTPTDLVELRDELRDLVAELDVINRLTAFGQTLQVLGDTDPAAKVFLLELKTENDKSVALTLRSYADTAVATEEYRALEEATQSDPGTDVVLVSVESLAALDKAYPNYFLDTTVFLETVVDAIA